MNARLPASALPLETHALQSHVDAAWRESIVPELQRYIAVPAKSPMFDPDWAAHGLLERVLQNAADWVRAQQVPGLQLEIVRLIDRTVSRERRCCSLNCRPAKARTARPPRPVARPC